MANVDDVAAYILSVRGCMPTMKLQKLIYYGQAWSLVWEERPLLQERIEAWANGPVVRSLYMRHRGQYEVSSWPYGSPDRLSAEEKETIDRVLDFYGDKSSQWLSDLTHKEAPWRLARRGLPDSARGDHEITRASMAEYYGSLASRHQS